MRSYARIIFGLIGIAALASCAEGARYAGLRSCSADGSVVWWEYPNHAGNYEGLDNKAQNCGPKG